jgi:hypothetical protein
MAAEWRERREQWRRFHEWELEQLQALPDDFGAAVAWMAEAWELARRLDPEWDSDAARDERIRHLARVHAVLAQLGTRT